MREHEAQAVLLVKAFEEADPDGLLLPADDRRQATEAARASTSDPAEAAFARAERLLPVLEARLPGTAGLLRGTRIGAGLAPVVLAAAFVVGLVSNALGPHRRIDVWQWPFVFLFAWNLVWYAIFLAGPLLHRGRPGAHAGALAQGAHAVVALAGRGTRLAGRIFEWALGRFTSRARKRDAKTAGIAASAIGRYAAEWRRATGPLLAARTRLLLHAGSLALALGLVVGMYARALTFKYEAAWESTILDAATLQKMVNALLGPAATVLGRRVPDVRPYEAPTHDDAAPWLHLYAMATLLYVAIPRALFFLRESARVARLSARVPADLSLGYARRAGLAPAGEGRRVVWRGYGYHPAPRAADAFTGLLHAAFGTKCEIDRATDVDYGADDPDAGPASDATAVLLVSLAQTPESEVHGAFVAARVARGARPLVVADASPLVARGADATRLDERRRLWSRIGREAGVDLVHVDLAANEGDAAADRLAAAAGLVSGAAGSAGPGRGTAGGGGGGPP